MKHKLIKVIAVMVIAAFAVQSLVWGQTKGEVISTGVEISPDPLSPSQRPLAEGEGESRLAPRCPNTGRSAPRRVARESIPGNEGKALPSSWLLVLSKKEGLRARAFAERNKIEMQIIDVDEIGDIDQVVSSITEINNRIGGVFKIDNRHTCIRVRRSYKKDPDYLGLVTHLRTFLIIINGRIIGYIVYNHFGEKSHIEFIAVHPEFEGGGGGTMLLRRVFRFARENGKNFVTVDTYANNKKAIDFYRKKGRALSRYCTEDFQDPAKDAVRFTFYLVRQPFWKRMLRLFGMDKLEIDLPYTQI